MLNLVYTIIYKLYNTPFINCFNKSYYSKYSITKQVQSGLPQLKIPRTAPVVRYESIRRITFQFFSAYKQNKNL